MPEKEFATILAGLPDTHSHGGRKEKRTSAGVRLSRDPQWNAVCKESLSKFRCFILVVTRSHQCAACTVPCKLKYGDIRVCIEE